MSSEKIPSGDDNANSMLNMTRRDAVGRLLECPISRTIMGDPVSTPIGQTYDLHSLVQAWNGSNNLTVQDPLSRTPHTRMVVANWTIRGFISTMLPEHQITKRDVGNIIFVHGAFEKGYVELQKKDGWWTRADGKELPDWMRKRMGMGGAGTSGARALHSAASTGSVAVPAVDIQVNVSLPSLDAENPRARTALLDELAEVAAQEACALQKEEAELNARVQVQGKSVAVQDKEQGMYDKQFSVSKFA